MKFVMVVFFSIFACQPGTDNAQAALPTGVWGGKGIQLTVTAKGAAVDYGCDSGTIDRRPQMDAGGKFRERGTHVFGTGGPRTPGDRAPKAPEARYEGVRTGDKLEITVHLPESNRRLGKFTLQLGRRPDLERCG